jgi:hypothetical protein
MQEFREGGKWLGATEVTDVRFAEDESTSFAGRFYGSVVRPMGPRIVHGFNLDDNLRSYHGQRMPDAWSRQRYYIHLDKAPRVQPEHEPAAADGGRNPEPGTRPFL